MAHYHHHSISIGPALVLLNFYFFFPPTPSPSVSIYSDIHTLRNVFVCLCLFCMYVNGIIDLFVPYLSHPIPLYLIPSHQSLLLTVLIFHYLHPTHAYSFPQVWNLYCISGPDIIILQIHLKDLCKYFFVALTQERDSGSLVNTMAYQAVYRDSHFPHSHQHLIILSFLIFSFSFDILFLDFFDSWWGWAFFRILVSHVNCLFLSFAHCSWVTQFFLVFAEVPYILNILTVWDD